MLRIASALAAALFFFSSPALADPECVPLIAGQHEVAGTVCVDNDDDTMTVTYSTQDGWTLGQLHLAVGTSLDEIPTNRPGNPQVGLFPYHADADGATEYTFEIPLAPGECDEEFVIAAHAEVSKEVNGSIQQETAWGDGTRFVQRGNWATWFTYTATCDVPGDPDGKQPVPCETDTQTAFAYGDTTLNALGHDTWGWQLTVNDGTAHGHAWLLVDAEDNVFDVDKIMGRILYTYASGSLTVTIESAIGWRLIHSYVYAKDEQVPAVEPIDYMFDHVHGPQQSHYSWSYDDKAVEGDPIYMVVNVEICPTT